MLNITANRMPVRIGLLALLALAMAAGAVEARTLRVDPRASQDARALRLAYIASAVSSARPGDTIALAAGDHQGPLRIGPGRGGKAGAWLTITAERDLAATIVGQPGSAEPAFGINGARFIEVRGLRARHPGIGDCFGARTAAHIRFIANVAADCGGGGIAAMQSDHIRIEGNIAARNAFTSPWQNSGISIYQPRAVDDAPGPHVVIVNNIALLNDNRAPSPGQTFATDGNGIIVDDGRNTQNGSQAGPYRAGVLVANNLSIGNGGSGVRAFLTDNVTIERNTTYWNDRTDSPRQGERSEIAVMDCAGCTVRANLAVVGPWPRDTAALFVLGDQTGTTIAGNVFADARPGRRLINAHKPSRLPQASDNATVLPRFARAILDGAGDFTVRGWQGAAPKTAVGADTTTLPSLSRLASAP
jgi:hypothetical protein